MSLRRSLILMTAIAALLAGCSSGSEDSTSAADGPTATNQASATVVSDPAHLVGVDEFAKIIDEPGVVTINVHVPDEGNLPGTDLSIPFDEIAGSKELPTNLDTPLAIYCRSGNMSADAVVDLDALGYTNIVELKNGFKAWVAEGRPLLEPGGN